MSRRDLFDFAYDRAGMRKATMTDLSLVTGPVSHFADPIRREQPAPSWQIGTGKW
jgi:hypothetical protein